MSDNDRFDRGAERPRSEPEIIPPGRGRAATSAIWIQVEERDGVRRVSFKRPGPFSIFLAVLAGGLALALVLALLAGLLLFWIPLVALAVIFAIASLSLRSYWRRLQIWWASR
ncbi:MAG TPA: hypothetical protein VFA53_03765 [Xanthobacteraceae bacterium]|nr:hypothetical protein [Xanthobacteraceae bacterium]